MKSFAHLYQANDPRVKNIPVPVYFSVPKTKYRLSKPSWKRVMRDVKFLLFKK